MNSTNTSLNQPNTDSKFRQRHFELFPEHFVFDNWGLNPPADYIPQSGSAPLGERLPINWESSYREKYKQFFQPAVFFRNCAMLSNMARKNPAHATACAELFDELFTSLMAHSVLDDGKRYVVNNFDFLRYGTTIPSGWSGSIMNAFAITGLLKVQTQFQRPEYAQAIREFVAAFTLLHQHDRPPPQRWISYVDEDEYLWFDEYPLPEGNACRVLNGHIFSVFALALYYNWSQDSEIYNYLQGGITTIKENVLRFRRPAKINLYDLRSPTYADYAPNRTIKQQAQLYALTGDDFFRGMAYIFFQDFKDSGFDSQEWALLPIASKTASPVPV